MKHLLLAGLLLCVGAWAEAEETAYNVLFITIDDLRDIGSYDPMVRKPNLDRLAASGVHFEQAYVQTTFCNPSRTSFLTGLRPTRTGVLDNRTHFRDHLPEVVTLPQLFRQNGYYTYRLGKIFHGGASMDDPASWDRAEFPETTDLGRQGRRWYPPEKTPPWCWSLEAEGTDEDQPDGQTAALAVEFLRQSHEKPFFLAVGFHKPHDPFVAPKAYFAGYGLDEVKLHPTPADATPTPARQIGGPWMPVFDAFSDTDRKEFLRAYYAGTTFMDAQLGKVLDALEETGLSKNTVVCLLSDHGYHLGERGWWNKSTLYEYSARSPLMIRVPGMTSAGTPCRRVVEFVDIYPTLAGLCGLNPPPDLAGRDLRPLLDDPTAAWDHPAFSYIRRGSEIGISIRTEQWRYIEWPDGVDTELFDQTADSGNWYNLAARAEYAEVMRRLSERIAGMR